MHSKEKTFRSFIGSRNAWNRLRAQFCDAQRKFDKSLRKKEREYNKESVIHIETMNTNNPTEFWKSIKNLGPRNKTEIPMKVRDGNTIITDPEMVLELWNRDFSSLYNRPDDSILDFDLEFLDFVKNDKMNIEATMTENVSDGTWLNRNIEFSEVLNVVSKLKAKKAVGLDSVPNEVLKNHGVIRILCALFNQCSGFSKVPSMWVKAIISPIPKSSQKDPYVPLNYRGISLLSTLSKVYTALLNARLTFYFEDLGFFANEQNGFRKNRSCLDHAYT